MAENHPVQGTLNFLAAVESLRFQTRRALEDALTLERKGDPFTDIAFEEAERLAEQVADPEVLAVVCEAFGLFLKRQRKFGPARDRLERAERNARLLDLDETVARIKLSIVGVEVELATNTRMKAFFHNFVEAAGEGSYSWQDRLDAWFGFVSDLNRSVGRLAARSIGSKADFRKRLDVARRGRGEG